MPSIDAKKLQGLLKDYYTLTGMRIGLLDYSAQELISFPSQPCRLCMLIRSNPELDKKCRECDHQAFINCQKNTSPQVFTCHAGLLTFIAPVKTENHILAYIMCGEVFDKALIEEQQRKVYEYLKPYHFPEKELQEAIFSMDSREREELNAAITILESLTMFCMNKKMIKTNEKGFFIELNEYIDSHLNRPIHISDLCNHFFISRSLLYKLSRPYMDCPLAEYIQRRRILRATELVKKTDISFTEISLQTGFSEYNYFLRVFKKFTGLTLKEYHHRYHGNASGLADGNPD